ncbi:MAG: NADH-quinone oxidoreductase subunit J [Anaerolineae bacterium]
MVMAITAAVILVCAVQAMLSRRLLVSAIWLAGTSASVALLIYLLGAPEIAVIELSVGAGLVTILFLFTINMAGDEPIIPRVSLPRPLIWILIGATIALLGWLALPNLNTPITVVVSTTFTQAVWQDRSLDTLLQLVLIFAAALGVLSLLSGKLERPEEEHKS